MDANDPRHGTYAGWQTHHRTNSRPICEPCRNARREYQRARHADHNAGRPRRVPNHTVRNHVTHLLDSGMTAAHIANLAGVHYHTIAAILNQTRPLVTADHASWILAVTPNPHSQAMVPGVGAARRLQALARLGWTSEQIAEVACRAGHDVQASTFKSVRNLRRPMVRFSTYRAIAAAYDELSMSFAPTNRGVLSWRTKAARLGWLPPLAWNDIDDPDEQPTDWAYVPTDRATAVRELAGQGEGPTQIARRLDMTPRALERWCQRHMPDVWRVLQNREGDWNSKGNQGHQTRREGDAA